MPQPKTRRGVTSRDAIVAAAAQLMYELGVRATTLDDVLEAAGAGKSQLYHYFENKEEVVVAVLGHQLSAVLAEQAMFRLDTWRGLRAWFDALVEGQRARDFRGCPVGSMAAEMSAISDDLAEHVSRAFAHWHGVLSDAFHGMRSSRRLVDAARPDELATVTLAQIQGAYLLSSASQDIAPMKDALDAAYAHLRSFAQSPSSERRRR